MTNNTKDAKAADHRAHAGAPAAHPDASTAAAQQKAAEERAKGQHMRQDPPPNTTGEPREQKVVDTMDGTTAAEGSGADPKVNPPSEQHLEEKKKAEEAAKAAKGGKDKKVGLVNPADTGSGVDPAGMPSQPLETAEEREKREKEEAAEREKLEKEHDKDLHKPAM